MTDVADRDRKLVYHRDNKRCAACGRRDRALNVHHRANRQAGGSKVLDFLANYLTLCWHCNRSLELDPEFAEKGRQNGWKVEQGVDPAGVAVFFTWANQWRYLLPDGTFAVV